MAKKTSEKLTLRHLVGYGAGDMGACMCNYILAVYGSRFMQVNLQVNAAVLATMLLIWNIWDAVNDPMMGTIMDMCFAKAKPGADKFRPWALASIAPLALGCIGFFLIPSHLGGGIMMVAALFLLKIVSEAGYTMCNIAMGSMLGVMAVNNEERTKLSSARGLGSLANQFLAGIIIPKILAHYNESNQGYIMAAVVTCILGSIIIFTHYAWTEERNKAAQRNVEKTPEQVAAEKVKVTDILHVFRVNRSYLALCCYSLSSVGIGSLAYLAGSYMYADVLGDIGLMAYATMISTPLSIVVLFLCPMLTKKYELVNLIKTALAVSIVLYGGLLVYALTTEMNGYVYLVWVSLAAAASNIASSMQWGLVGESIDYNEYLTGKRSEGAIYGTFSLSRRVGQTISSSMTVMVISWLGYDATLAAAGLPQADSTILGIKLLVIGIPILASLCSLMSFQFLWNINKDVREKMAAWKAGREANA